MLLWKSHGLKIAELWFDEQLPAGSKPDIIRFRQSLTPKGEGVSDFFSLVTDLALDEDALAARLQKDNRYKIRRAEEKDGCLLEIWKGEAAFFDAFVTFYQDFAAQKGLAGLDVGHLRLMHRAGRLDLSRATTPEGEPLVYHAYYTHGDRVRLLFSASNFRGSSDNGFRSLVGRANRWLHWRDILRFKAEGKAWYDWGGWYEGKENADLLGINQFKESFGGEPIHTYHGEALLTLRAKVSVWVARLIGRR
ncbi:hypothetical protein [Geothrix sp. PMB-07]|uniref:hypothetical protein n=1 Tax=Geothrix sp. PMB-07 TaxID=3068640 RepID=UPI002740F858|nr:hypothetical protein [Geothrix sp. PMB-07]WLT30174.1 hypothetical protein Q9293_10640 [Geothrix sp. PMB-07]